MEDSVGDSNSKMAAGSTTAKIQKVTDNLDGISKIIDVGTNCLNKFTGTVKGVFGYGEEDNEREKTMLALEQSRHESEMHRLEEEENEATENATRANAVRQENYNTVNLDLQRRQMERKKREQEILKQKNNRQRDIEEQLEREREVYDKNLRTAEDKNRQLRADTQAELESTHQHFLATKTHMENTHQMEVNMIKGLAGATAYLYKEMGYFEGGDPENNRNRGNHIPELEAAPTYQ